jgi:hypothetical protein
MVSREAAIIAYSNDFRLLSYLTIPSLAMLLLIRRATPPAPPAAPAMPAR